MFNLNGNYKKSSRNSLNRATRRPVFESLQARELMAGDVTAAVQAPFEISPAEQLMVELVNRARANPTAESLRYGIDLNAGLSGTEQLNPTPKQPLAPVPAIHTAASLHSTDMLMRDYFDHQAKDPVPHGKTPSDRAIAAGYGNGVGENIAIWPLNGLSQEASVQGSHKLLVQSSGHRRNILDGNYNDIGIGIETGDYSGDFFKGQSYQTMLVTENFGIGVNTQRAITGVVFADNLEDNDFYNMGEGIGGFSIVAVRSSGERFATTTGSSGGYALRVPEGTYQVFAANGNDSEILVGEVNVNSQNVKLDVMTDKLSATPRLDVNSDGMLSPLDALIVINYLNLEPSQQQKLPFRDDLDVNRNGIVEAVDVLIVINELNRRSNAATQSNSAEGEADGINQGQTPIAAPQVILQDNAWFSDGIAVRINRR